MISRDGNFSFELVNCTLTNTLGIMYKASPLHYLGFSALSATFIYHTVLWMESLTKGARLCCYQSFSSSK